MKKIAFAGTDGRTLLCAFVVSTATSELYDDDFQGVVFRGTPAMPQFSKSMNWPVEFIATKDNSVSGYTEAVIQALDKGAVDYVVPMPEALLFDGLVDALEQKGFGSQVLGLNSTAAFIEGDKIACKQLCQEAGIPVADDWSHVDAKDYDSILKTCLTQASLSTTTRWPTLRT